MDVMKFRQRVIHFPDFFPAQKVIEQDFMFIVLIASESYLPVYLVSRTLDI